MPSPAESLVDLLVDAGCAFLPECPKADPDAPPLEHGDPVPPPVTNDDANPWPICANGMPDEALLADILPGPFCRRSVSIYDDESFLTGACINSCSICVEFNLRIRVADCDSNAARAQLCKILGLLCGASIPLDCMPDRPDAIGQVIRSRLGSPVPQLIPGFGGADDERCYWQAEVQVVS